MKRQLGMTLTELLVVVAVMAILLGISVPTAQRLMDSFESSTGVRHLINAALSNARAIAVRQQAYAGVRFQQAGDGKTYMIFIVHDKDATGDAQGFCAVMGRKPMPLPEGISVAAAVQRTDGVSSNEPFFSVIFSPSGKLTIHPVQCLRSSQNDTVFNSTGNSMFVQDISYSWFSVQSFELVRKDKFGATVASTTEYISPYTGELVLEYQE